jgi:SAM-dependent methyltransferase
MNLRVDWSGGRGPVAASTTTDAGTAYNDAGDAYVAYADGDTTRLYAFDGHYAYCDRRLWEHLDELLVRRRKSGATSLTVLDAGCGPGTWLRRIVVRARALGFTNIDARGFDVAGNQVARARELSAQVARQEGVRLVFDVADLTDPLPEDDGSIDLCLCLYGVLTHVPIACVSKVIAEFARVTAGHFVATVRAAGSTPTVFVGELECARDFRQNHGTDRCMVELKDGRRIELNSHLYTATELRALVEQHFEIEELRGLDLFHTRFAPDRRWNPPSAEADAQFHKTLVRLEDDYARNPHFIDRAAHLLVIGSVPTWCRTGRERHLHLCLPKPSTAIW